MNDARATYCGSCGHEAQSARAFCRCNQCQGDRNQQEYDNRPTLRESDRAYNDASERFHRHR